MSYQPFNIGKNFRITPADTFSPGDKRIDLIMQRGAFGSGEHETTESCLALMEGMPEIENARILDVGSGTGILAIAALKLGAAHAVCVDIEAGAVETAKRNCQLNGLEDKATHILGTLDDVSEQDFDIVFANIYGDILLMLAKPLCAAVRPGGRLLLSGILWEYNFPVRQAYERYGCVIRKNMMLEEFSTVLLDKK